MAAETHQSAQLGHFEDFLGLWTVNQAPAEKHQNAQLGQFEDF